MTEKESASFVCEISHDDVDCQWYKGGTKLKVGDNIKMRQEGKPPGKRNLLNNSLFKLCCSFLFLIQTDFFH